MNSVLSGLEVFLKNPPFKNAVPEIGLLCNPASVDSSINHAKHLIAACYPGKLKALYSPQHGLNAEKQDNMCESADFTDPDLHIPVFSLYGDTRIPTLEMLDPVETLVIDLIDVGTRVYTFAATVSYCLEQAALLDKKVVILDRPNPVSGNMVEGNFLIPEFASFVGRYPIPMRHGLTMGELASYINTHHGIGCDLTVIHMSGWKRSMFYKDTRLPWVLPSPNLPTAESALVYPGQVILEGTNISEGRGTTKPFEYIGAPYFDTDALISHMNLTCPKGRTAQVPGALLRPISFEPTFGKWMGTACRGFQIHVTDPSAYRSYETAVRLLDAVISVHGDSFRWKEPPYEYEYEKLPIDLIFGDDKVRKRLESHENIDDIIHDFEKDAAAFREMSEPHKLYRD